MPPNLCSNLSLGRMKISGFGKNTNVVRTEFVVRNIYAYLLENEYFVQRVSAVTSAEKDVIEAFQNVVDVFKASYSESMVELSAALEVTPETVGSVILGVSNELFNEGINWSKISTFFVFISELSIQCLRKNFPEIVVLDILDCSMKYVEESLLKWIMDHGGWEGIIEFSNGHKKGAVQRPLQNTNNAMRNSGWAKSAIYGTVRVLGTLAHFASFADPALSFPMNSE